MSKINENFDPNNPQHKVVMDINSKNEEMYGPYHEECGLFKEFCKCGKDYVHGKTYLVNADAIKTLDDVKMVIKNMNLHFTPNTRESFNEINHLLTEKKPITINISNE